MAFNEGLKQRIDMLGALQARRQMEQSSEQRKQQELQNQLMQEQLEAAKWQNLVSKDRPTITLPAGPGLGGMREKQFLDQQAGYISGVSPTDTFNQWNQNFRQGMASGGGGGRGGYGGGEPATPAPTMEYYGPDHSKPMDSASIAGELSKLYQTAPQADNLGGGSMKDATTGTYKEFSQNPTGSVGRYVDASGGETTTGPSAAADYQSGLAGKADVEKILKEREMVPVKQAEAKAQVLNNAAKSISGDPRFKALDDEIKSKILGNIGAIVEDNIKTKGTPMLEVGEVIAKYGK